MKRTIFAVALMLVFALASFAASVHGDFTVIEKDKNLSIVTGGGGTSTVYKDPASKRVFVIDTKRGEASQQLKNYVDKFAKGYSVVIINTHIHGDHTGGNKLFKNGTIISGDYDDKFWKEQTGTDLNIKVVPGKVLPFATKDDMLIISNQGNAHTEKDLVVYFKNRKILAIGDLVFNGLHPVMKKENKTNPEKWNAVLGKIIKTFNDAETVVPGHGRQGGIEIIRRQKEYLDDLLAGQNDRKRAKMFKKKYKDYIEIGKISSAKKNLKYKY